MTSVWLTLLWCLFLLCHSGRKRKLPARTDPQYEAERDAAANFFRAANRENPAPPQPPQPQANEPADPLNALLEEDQPGEADEALQQAEALLANNIDPQNQLPQNLPVPVEIAGPDDNAPNDPPPKRRGVNAQRLVERWSRHDQYGVFEVDISSEHYRCSVCVKAESGCQLATWQPLNWRKATDYFKRHLGLDTKDKSGRGKAHGASVRELERREQIEANKDRSKDNLLEGINRAATEQAKFREKQAG